MRNLNNDLGGFLPESIEEYCNELGKTPYRVTEDGYYLIYLYRYVFTSSYSTGSILVNNFPVFTSSSTDTRSNVTMGSIMLPLVKNTTISCTTECQFMITRLSGYKF